MKAPERRDFQDRSALSMMLFRCDGGRKDTVLSLTRLAGRVALVTGAARGIGRGCALCLAEEGADICLNERDQMQEAHNTAGEIEAMGRKVRVVQADIGRIENVDSLVSTAVAEFG